MCKFARDIDAEEIFVGTEVGILHRLRNENSQKRFHSVANLPYVEI